VDIVLPENMTLKEAHNIGEPLQRKLERLKDIERAFVHIDYEFTHKAAWYFKAIFFSTIERCSKFPVFKDKSGTLYEPIWKQIESRALEVGNIRLHRMVQGEDLFAREANSHQSCRKSFNLQYVNDMRYKSQSSRYVYNTEQGRITDAHLKSFNTVLVQLTSLCLLYIQELERHGIANPAYRSEKLKDCLENHDIYKSIAFAKVNPGDKGCITYNLVYSTNMSVADVVTYAYKLGSKDKYHEVAELLCTKMNQAFNQSQPLPWPPTADDFELHSPDALLPAELVKFLNISGDADMVYNSNLLYCKYGIMEALGRGVLCMLIVVATRTVDTEAMYTTGSVSIIDGHAVLKRDRLDKSSTAYGTYNDTMYTTGWGVFNVKAGYSKSDMKDTDVMYAAGYLEGALTAERIYQHYVNIHSLFLGKGKEDLERKVRIFFNKQEDWVRQQISDNLSSEYWKAVSVIIAQLDGLVDGYTAYPYENKTLDRFAFQLLNGVGDMIDLRDALSPSTRPDWTKMSPSHFQMYFANHGHCSALFKCSSNGLEGMKSTPRRAPHLPGCCPNLAWSYTHPRS
uniref:Phospholipase B-like n=1 Tax=Saccoglossus kowalevskii TaxID=10224 RepID=A0ABM0MB20_SACKO